MSRILAVPQEMMNGFMFYIDANEKLGTEIDGKTGGVKGK